jgi:hypothetical protein
MPPVEGVPTHVVIHNKLRLLASMPVKAIVADGGLHARSDLRVS